MGLPAAAPRTLGKYRLDRLIGKGGMGEVYAAWDTTLDRLVALKTIRSESDDAAHAERFRREGRAAARLRHPQIVTIYELGEADGKLYMAMEYLEGESLAAAARAGSLSDARKLDVLGLLLDGLHHAHGHDVVHRDVKPSNVQLVPDGGLKVLDFGIARLMAAESLSHTGMVLGTVPYMSPEQLRGERVDHRTDIYAAGIVAYELFAGRRPFDGQTLTEIVLKVINDPLPALDERCARTHPGLEEVLRRALDKCAANRYASAAEMAHALRALAAPAPAVPPPSAVREPASTTFRVPRIAVAQPAAPVPAPAAPPPAAPAAPRAPRPGRAAIGLTAALALLCGGGLLAARRWGGPVPAPPPPPPPAGAASALLPVTAAPSPSPPATPTPAPERPAAPPRAPADGTLARALAAELAGRAVRVGPVTADLQVALRPAPFAASAATTADFTARAVVTRKGGATARCTVNGQALAFSALAARAAAVQRAAEQLADCVAAAR